MKVTLDRLGHSAMAAQCPLYPVGSIGRCNTSIKSFGSGFEAQSLARPFVELPSHSVELRMRAASGSTTHPPWPPR